MPRPICDFASFHHNLLKSGHCEYLHLHENQNLQVQHGCLFLMVVWTKIILEILLLWILTTSTFFWTQGVVTSSAADLLLANNVLMAVMENSRNDGTVSAYATILFTLFKPNDMKHCCAAKVYLVQGASSPQGQNQADGTFQAASSGELSWKDAVCP